MLSQRGYTSTVRKKVWGNNKFSWEFVVDIPSGEYDKKGNPKRKQKRVSGFKKEKDAKEAERKFLQQLEDGNIQIDVNSTFTELANKFFKHIEESSDYEKGTVSNYKGYFNNHMLFFHNMKAKNINDETIDIWVKEREKSGVSVYVINGCRKFGMSVFTYHKKQFRFNPFAEMDRKTETKKLRNRLTVETLQKMFDICKVHLEDYYCVFCLSVLTGMRLGEYTALDVEDFKTDRCKVYVNKQYTRRELKARTKTESSTRIADYPAELNEILKWHRRKFNIFSGLMFRGKNNNPVSENWVRARFQKLLELCGLPKNYMRVHDLRGEYVDLMNSAGVPIKFISRNIGHARTSTTNDIYTEIFQSVETDAMQKLGNMFFSK